MTSAAVGGSVLIIDDTPTNLKILAQLLSDRGYAVRVALDGPQGLKSAALQPPDLILLDVMMPIMNGYSVCEQLKADPALRDIPVIFISALAETFNKLRAFQVGGVDYITKPFQVAEVIARVETHMTLRRLQRQQREWAVQQERRRIAQDLHDAVNQTLFTLGLKAQLLHLQQADALPQLADELRSIHELAQAAIAEMRVLLFELRPESLTKTPLDRLLAQLVRAIQPHTSAQVALNGQCVALSPPPDVQIALYRMTQEALNNAIKHAEATKITLHFACTARSISVIIEDNGKGFDPETIPSDRFGIRGMQERAAHNNIRLQVTSTPGGGTQLHMDWHQAG